MLVLNGCGQKPREFTAKQAIDALSAQSAQVQTERGTAWISAKTPEGNLSFPAIIVVDRTNPKAQLLRLEINDLVGSTHALIILDRESRFTWINYDRRRIFEMRDTWNGLPLTKLPELMLGLATMPENGTVSAVDQDSFEIRMTKTKRASSVHYLMSWIDPGPRLALSGVVGSVQKTKKSSESYTVSFSKFMDNKDFYLPREVELKGHAANPDDPNVELKISWRERRWNEKIPEQVFTLPKSGLEDFKRD